MIDANLSTSHDIEIDKPVGGIRRGADQPHRADVTIRIRDRPQSTRIGRPLGEVRRVIVAARAYLERCGRPQAPADLADHDCVIRRGDAEAISWKPTSKAGRAAVAVKGRFETNNAPAQVAAIAQGLGIGVVAY